jgi:signal transduction histidine kinase
MDSGIGIAPEDKALIFERFYRTDKARTRALGGAGLGLSIAREITAIHDADLELKAIRERVLTSLQVQNGRRDRSFDSDQDCRANPQLIVRFP